MLRIAVYGSLREGMGNSGLLNTARKLSTEVVTLPFEMIDMGGFPGLVKSEEQKQVVAEIYEVDEVTYKRVERLESYPSFYTKHTVETTQGATEIYVLNQSRESNRESWYHGYESSPRVTLFEGVYDWVKHVKSRGRNY